MNHADDAAFAAVADGTRRAILDLLLVRKSMTAGQLAAAFPQISRPAVSKHLKVLQEAGLVRVRVVGREHYYSLDPAPIARMYESWYRRYEQFWTDKLLALKELLEREEEQGR